MAGSGSRIVQEPQLLEDNGVEVRHQRLKRALGLRQHLLRQLDAGGTDGRYARCPSASRLWPALPAPAASPPQNRHPASGTARPSSGPGQGRCGSTPSADRSRSHGTRPLGLPPRTPPDHRSPWRCRRRCLRGASMPLRRRPPGCARGYDRPSGWSRRRSRRSVPPRHREENRAPSRSGSAKRSGKEPHLGTASYLNRAACQPALFRDTM